MIALTRHNQNSGHCSSEQAKYSLASMTLDSLQMSELPYSRETSQADCLPTELLRFSPFIASATDHTILLVPPRLDNVHLSSLGPVWCWSYPNFQSIRELTFFSKKRKKLFPLYSITFFKILNEKVWLPEWLYCCIFQSLFWNSKTKYCLDHSLSGITILFP